ncbi:MAG: class II glutamine amidotransferase, partial [Reyranella sp.]|nr:class II glutamine amidotransferase [Reyranella sp.]
AFAAEMRPLGIANFLYSDGEFVFGHGHRRTQADGIVAPPGLWVRHSRHSGAHAAAIAPPAASGVTIHQDEQASEHRQEMALLASVPVTGGHWSPLAEGEVVVLSGGRLVEETM